MVAHQLLWEKDLPGEQGGEGGLKAALEHHSTAKETVGRMLSFCDLILHALHFQILSIFSSWDRWYVLRPQLGGAANIQLIQKGWSLRAWVEKVLKLIVQH